MHPNLVFTLQPSGWTPPSTCGQSAFPTLRRLIILLQSSLIIIHLSFVIVSPTTVLSFSWISSIFGAGRHLNRNSLLHQGAVSPPTTCKVQDMMRSTSGHCKCLDVSAILFGHRATDHIQRRGLRLLDPSTYYVDYTRINPILQEFNSPQGCTTFSPQFWCKGIG